MIVKCRTVKRYYALGRGFATEFQAYRAVAKKQLLAEIEADCGEKYDGYRNGVFSTRMLERYSSDEEGTYEPYFDSSKWQRAIDERAKKIQSEDIQLDFASPGLHE